MSDNDCYVLDGNAAAGLLHEFFVVDVTTAHTRCGGCGATHVLGALRVYAVPMGAVLRCSSCQRILLRAVKTPHGRWLEMSGAQYLRF
ncbi:MAG TPA: DUF6510 family protein [Burkholderiales bacterium]|nr:DUF6510 family protein [Burkholderiales bacterium]